MKPIPIKSAKEISKEFEVPEVVIFGYDPQTGKQHVTTYGKTIDQCKDAARAGNYLKKALGWPAELCNAEPSRAKKQQDELTRLRAEVERLKAEPDFKKMTAMSKLTSAVQMVSYCNGLEQENADLKAEVERLSKCDETWKTAVTEMCDQAEQIDNLKAEVERLRGDGWISVKERLPEKNAGVTIYTPHGGVDTRALGMCDDDPNGLWYCYKGVGEPLHFNDVTHWRPLPEPPRGE